MKVKHYTDVESADANMAGAEGSKIRWLLGPEDNMPNFHLRMIEVEADGYTPRHQHPYEHQVYVLEGKGEIIDPDGKAISLKPGNTAYVAAGELHQFVNTGSETFRFLCIIPRLED